MEGLSVNKTAHDGHAAAAAGGVSALMTLEPAFTRGLQTAAVDEFRRNYQRFREGKARGARGERPTAAPRVRTCELPFKRIWVPDILLDTHTHSQEVTGLLHGSVLLITTIRVAFPLCE